MGQCYAQHKGVEGRLSAVSSEGSLSNMPMGCLSDCIEAFLSLNQSRALTVLPMLGPRGWQLLHCLAILACY